MAAAAVDSTVAYPESPVEGDDAPYPCKGCGEILEEGKAFELAGNRWHIDCFRCNTCDTLLDSDANLLLLGDGSLICNNCTYSCSSCGNKIEDLAILTGDQAFCANCFKCRNCKNKIENLRYARTSQGIFCMDCHEALMAKRRKKTGRNPASRSKLSNNVQLDKSLPAIPPPNSKARSTLYSPNDSPYSQSYQSPPVDVPPLGKTVSELRELGTRPGATDNTQSRDALTLPSTTFNDRRQSYQSQHSDMSGGEDFMIPVAFDPTPPVVQSPPIGSQGSMRADDRSRDYFGRGPVSPSILLSQSKTNSPHIADQVKGRQGSKDKEPEPTKLRREGSESMPAPVTESPRALVERSQPAPEESEGVTQLARSGLSSEDRFKLQDAPNTRKAHSTKGSPPEPAGARLDGPFIMNHSTMSGQDTTDDDTAYLTPQLSMDESSPEMTDSPRPAQHPTTTLLANLPKRGDSLESAKRSQQTAIPRKEVAATASLPQSISDVLNKGASSSNTTITSRHTPTPSELARANGGKVISAPIESPASKSMYDTPSIPPSAPSSTKDVNLPFVDPRSAPAPPPTHAHSRSRNESLGTLQSEARTGPVKKSPSLPRYSAGGDFTLDEDMARILGQDEAGNSFLKRVSNSVRHGRSYSDKAGRLSRDKWPRSPDANTSIGQEISSPSTASPENREEVAWFKNELRRERQKTIDREKRISELETQLGSTAAISQVNSELKEKRSTMVVLDAQKEIVVRELEVLTEHIAAVKRNKEPLDVAKMTNAVVREFAEELEKLRSSYAPQIEASIQKRNKLFDEIANLTQMKDKSFMEFEQLSSKNAQLAELNNQLVHQIQNLYKANSQQPQQPEPTKPVNGLGIYAHHKDKSNISVDLNRTGSVDASIDSGTTLQAGEAEPVTVIQGPHVVNIRKGAQPKKFDWRKGQKVAKGVTKGLKGAFSSAQQSYSRDLQFAETGAYGAQLTGQEYATTPKGNQEPVKQNSGSNSGGFGFFGSGGGQRPGGRSNGLYANSGQGTASTADLILDASTHLFGADLEERAEFEKATVPAVVRRCVEEVEARGMDVEGIYRKSGANSQVQQVRDGFERDPYNCDISDEDLDIHSVTSGLKQYFRKLPIPLITYEVYDKLLDIASIPIDDREARIEAMKVAVRGLPKVNYDVLEYLMEHLRKVVDMQEENLMTSTNVAVVFAPTIMRSESVQRELGDTKGKNEVVALMVEEGERVFS